MEASRICSVQTHPREVQANNKTSNILYIYFYKSCFIYIYQYIHVFIFGAFKQSLKFLLGKCDTAARHSKMALYHLQ